MTEKASKGEPLRIEATTWNTLVDVAAAHRARQTPFGSKGTTYRPPDTDVVLVKNDSGGDRDRFSVLGIDTPIIAPSDNQAEFDNRPAFSASLPAAANHVGGWCLLIEPIASGRVGRAVVSGVTPAIITVNDVSDHYVDIADGDDELSSGQWGAARILWKESGTGSGKRAIIRVGDAYWERRFELKTELTLGGTATAHPLRWTGSSYTPDTASAADFTVYDSRGLYRGWTRETTPARSGSWGLARFHHDKGVWEVVDMQHIARAITFTLTEDMGGTSSGLATVTVDDYYQGVNPGIIYPAGVDVYDPQGLHPNAPSGAKGKAIFDDRSDEYHIVEMDDYHMGYACVQSGWTNTKGGVGVGSWVSEAVSVKLCDYDDASTATGAAFDVNTMPRKNQDTALFDDYIVRWELAPNGDKVITTDIWDLPFNRVLWESVDTANIRDGWALCDGDNGTRDLRGRFIIGLDEANGANAEDPALDLENAIGLTGGERTQETALPFDSVVGTPGFGNGDFTTTECRSSDRDNIGDLDDTRPRFYVLAAIERVA